MIQLLEILEMYQHLAYLVVEVPEKTLLVQEENTLQKNTWDPHEAALPHPIWNSEQVSSVQVRAVHLSPSGTVNRSPAFR